jgi:hypothetical protein
LEIFEEFGKDRRDLECIGIIRNAYEVFRIFRKIHKSLGNLSKNLGNFGKSWIS